MVVVVGLWERVVVGGLWWKVGCKGGLEHWLALGKYDTHSREVVPLACARDTHTTSLPTAGGNFSENRTKRGEKLGVPEA